MWPLSKFLGYPFFAYLISPTFASPRGCSCLLRWSYDPQIDTSPQVDFKLCLSFRKKESCESAIPATSWGAGINTLMSFESSRRNPVAPYQNKLHLTSQVRGRARKGKRTLQSCEDRRLIFKDRLGCLFGSLSCVAFWERRALPATED
ncbi:MAG: hypothetical protein J3Q66DRAFT_369417 [Benniella sp.]|nr:MAG: hypothetical protein J3Q66DRAFT_369417 [Benniella sp.]